MKLLLTILFFTSIFVVKSQPGTLDYSFGDSGKVISTTYNAYIHASLLQPDGKIVTGGEGGYYKDGVAIGGALLTRYNTDGSLDLSFGDSGRAVFNLGISNSKTIYAMALQKDGKIVAAMRGYNSFAILRANEDGTTDKSFGEGGLALGNEDHGYIGRDVAILPDGRIVVTGDIFDRINDDDRSFIACLTPEGKLDKSFGQEGIAIIEFSSAIDVNAIAVTAGGKIVIGGQYYFTRTIFLMRYNSDGSKDKSFGADGIGELAFDLRVTDPGINDIAIAADNTIATAGEVYPDYSIYPSIFISKFLENGTPDKGFGAGGYTINTYEKNDVHANAVAVQMNGKIVTAGYFLKGDIAVITASRYNIDGAIDSSFAVNGVTKTVVTGDDVGSSIVIQKDGKIVVSGYSNTAENTVSATLVRYNGDDGKRQPLMVRIKRWLLHHGISWQVQQSKDVRYYAVQRSADNIVYKEIAKLSNKAQVNKYEDATPINGSSYYRLAAIGWDGSRTYSNTILIDESVNVKVFPNPVRDNLQLQGLAAGKTSVSVVDLQGNVRSSSLAAGSNYSVNTSQLTPGNYLLKLQHNSVTTTQPFVKE